MCGALKSSYVSACTTRRYMTSDELVEQVMRHVAALVQSDRVELSAVEKRDDWLADLTMCGESPQLQAVRKCLERRVDQLCAGVRRRVAATATTPLSLKRLCRLQVRAVIQQQMTSRALAELPHGLPQFITSLE